MIRLCDCKRGPASPGKRHYHTPGGIPNEWMERLAVEMNVAVKVLPFRPGKTKRDQRISGYRRISSHR